MKKFVRSLAVLLVFSMVFTMFLTACGQKEDDVTTGAADSKTGTVKSPESTTAVKEETQASASGEKKKIVIVQESKDEVRDGKQVKILETLSKGGYTDKSSEITQIQMNGDMAKAQEVVEQIKKIKPDVVIINEASTIFKTVGKTLEGSEIPVIVSGGIESIDTVDATGKPKNNITGIYTMPKDLQKNAFTLLNRAAPINGKKAVFISIPGYFKKEDVENSLKTLNIELKDYYEAKYIEDFQAAVSKYNADNEVGWILEGIWSNERKDGKPGGQLDLAKWDRENRKKPSVTYWELAVQFGLTCGLGVDIIECGAQAGEMAVKILDGEKVENIIAQEPRKVNIILNQKNAKDINITFPADIMGSASRIFTDYEGHYMK